MSITTKEKAILIAELKWEMENIVNKIDKTENLNKVANIYREAADLCDVMADKIHALEKG